MSAKHNRRPQNVKSPSRLKPVEVPPQARSLDQNDLEQLFPGLKHRAHALLEKHKAERHGIQTTELAQSGVRRQKRASQAWSNLRWENEEHFYAASYKQMIWELRDKARARKARPDREQAGNLASEFLAQFIEAGALRLSDLTTGSDNPSDLSVALANAFEWLRSRDLDLADLLCATSIEGRTPEELASKFGVSARSLRTWLSYAKSLLAEQLVKEFPKLTSHLPDHGTPQSKPSKKVRRNPRATRRGAG